LSGKFISTSVLYCNFNNELYRSNVILLMELLSWLNHNFYVSNEKCSDMVERNDITFKTGSTNTRSNVYVALNV